jgi:hypothetical protein
MRRGHQDCSLKGLPAADLCHHSAIRYDAFDKSLRSRAELLYRGGTGRYLDRRRNLMITRPMGDLLVHGGKLRQIACLHLQFVFVALVHRSPL